MKSPQKFAGPVPEVQSSFSSLFLSLLAKRGLSAPDEIGIFLEADLQSLNDPLLMRGMPEAVARIRKAVELREKILSSRLDFDDDFRIHSNE